MTTFNNSVRCPASDRGKCIVTVTIKEDGRITVGVSGIAVSNPGPEDNAQEIAENVAAILENGGELTIED